MECPDNPGREICIEVAVLRARNEWLENLLSEYIDHVVAEEGTAFLCEWMKPSTLSEEQWAKLKELERR